MAEDEGKSVRHQQVDARKQRMREITQKVERVRVEPANDEIRRVIKHPNGNRFPDSGSVEWPLDRFTRRRLAEGSVVRVDREQPQEEQREEPRRRYGQPDSEG